MVKENNSSSESLPKEERFVINMSSELIAYLCNDYSYRNPNRFSRLKALQDLLIRFQKAKLVSTCCKKVRFPAQAPLENEPSIEAVFLIWQAT